MSFEFKMTLFRFLIAPPVFGAAITVNLFFLLDVFGLKFDKAVKMKSFIHITLLVWIYISLVRISLY